MTEMRVDPDMMLLHAGRVDMSATEVGTIAGAVAAIDDEAFGLMCAFLPPIINEFWPTNLDAIRASSSRLQAAANGLREAARMLMETDQEISSSANQHSARISSFDDGGIR